jgi:hypothetical protein
MHRFLEPGSYCAIVSDPGTLTEPVGIAIRLVAPALIDTGGSPGTQVFASTITPGGTATRTFEVSQGGNVDVRLTSLAPVDVEMNLGIGVVSPDGTGCKYSRIVAVNPSGVSQLSVRADAGDYCATLFDIGNLTGQASFSMTIAHP